MGRLSTIFAMLASFGLCLVALSAAADDLPVGRLPDSVPQTAVMSNGTGFFVSTSGAVVTARHVVQDCKKILVMKNRILFPVRRAIISNKMDISLLFPALSVQAPAVIEANDKLQDSAPVYFLGDNVMRLGHDDHPALANALVAQDQAQESTEYEFHITGDSQPGYSGSPVLNASGHVIGLILGRQEFVHKMGVLVVGRSSSVVSVTPVAIKKLLDANKVPYRVSASSGEATMPTQSIAERISVGVICVK